jgi:hypothetical protein
MPTFFTIVKPNAGRQARPEAGAQRTLEGVACTPWLRLSKKGFSRGFLCLPRFIFHRTMLGFIPLTDNVIRLRLPILFLSLVSYAP